MRASMREADSYQPSFQDTDFVGLKYNRWGTYATIGNQTLQPAGGFTIE